MINDVNSEGGTKPKYNFVRYLLKIIKFIVATNKNCVTRTKHIVNFMLLGGLYHSIFLQQ